jgi:hypothetical protein
VDTSGSRSEIPGKFFKVVLQKDCEDQLQWLREKWSILHTVKLRQANWIGRIFHRNCILKHIIEG